MWYPVAIVVTDSRSDFPILEGRKIEHPTRQPFTWTVQHQWFCHITRVQICLIFSGCKFGRYPERAFVIAEELQNGVLNVIKITWYPDSKGGRVLSRSNGDVDSGLLNARFKIFGEELWVMMQQKRWHVIVSIPDTWPNKRGCQCQGSRYMQNLCKIIELQAMRVVLQLDVRLTKITSKILLRSSFPLGIQDAYHTSFAATLDLVSLPLHLLSLLRRLSTWMIWAKMTRQVRLPL
jgi:hypothetical protein